MSVLVPDAGGSVKLARSRKYRGLTANHVSCVVVCVPVTRVTGMEGEWHDFPQRGTTVKNVHFEIRWKSGIPLGRLNRGGVGEYGIAEGYLLERRKLQEGAADALEDRRPLRYLLLSEDAHGWIPGAVFPVQLPSPVGDARQEEPDRNS